MLSDGEAGVWKPRASKLLTVVPRSFTDRVFPNAAAGFLISQYSPQPQRQGPRSERLHRLRPQAGGGRHGCRLLRHGAPAAAAQRLELLQLGHPVGIYHSIQHFRGKTAYSLVNNIIPTVVMSAASATRSLKRRGTAAVH